MDSLHVVIASVGETMFDGASASLCVPSKAGMLTILPKHEPLIAELGAGTITVRITGAEEKTFEIEKGVLECSGSRAVVLV